MAVEIKVRLFGVFRGISGKDRLRMEFEKSASMRDVIQRLVQSFSPELRRVLIDPELVDPRPNALILVNGKEINVLKGLETHVGDGDEVVLIPVSHGG